MATKIDDYCDPNYNITRDHCSIAGGAATTAYAKFISFAATRLKAIHAKVVTAGTATTHALNAYIGTASVGAIALSTSTAGVTATLLLDEPVPSLETVEVRTGADATGVAIVTYEYEYQNGAAVTA